MTEWFASLGLMEINELTVALRLAMAGIFGGLLGFERTRKMRAAGLRTYMLVCMGAAIAMMTGQFISVNVGGSDPARIAAQVISGIGFIGAGTIMTTGYHRIKGLTTAAGLWVSACMGLAIGIGFYGGAVLMLIFILFSMIFGERIQDGYLAHGHRMRLYVLFEDAEYLRPFLLYLRKNNLTIVDFETINAIGSSISASFMIKFHERRNHAEVLAMLADQEGVAFIEET